MAFVLGEGWGLSGGVFLRLCTWISLRTADVFAVRRLYLNEFTSTLRVGKIVFCDHTNCNIYYQGNKEIGRVLIQAESYQKEKCIKNELNQFLPLSTHYLYHNDDGNVLAMQISKYFYYFKVWSSCPTCTNRRHHLA